MHLRRSGQSPCVMGLDLASEKKQPLIICGSGECGKTFSKLCSCSKAEHRSVTLSFSSGQLTPVMKNQYENLTAGPLSSDNSPGYKNLCGIAKALGGIPRIRCPKTRDILVFKGDQ